MPTPPPHTHLPTGRSSYALGGGVKTLYELNGMLYALSTGGSVFVVDTRAAIAGHLAVYELRSNSRKPYAFKELVVKLTDPGGVPFIGWVGGSGPDDLSTAALKQIGRNALPLAPLEEGEGEDRDL